MNAFEEMTLGEVEEMRKLCLDNKPIQDSDPMMLAGAVMFMTRRREEPNLDWVVFKASIRMADIKAFSIDLEAENLDPMNATTHYGTSPTSGISGGSRQMNTVL